MATILGTVQGILAQVFDGSLVSGMELQRGATHSSKGTPSYDVATGAATVSATSISRNVVIAEYRANEIFLSAGQILSSDRKIMIQEESGKAAPKAGDTVTVGGETFRLERVKTLAIGATALAYECQGRKG